MDRPSRFNFKNLKAILSDLLVAHPQNTEQKEYILSTLKKFKEEIAQGELNLDRLERKIVAREKLIAEKESLQKSELELLAYEILTQTVLLPTGCDNTVIGEIINQGIPFEYNKKNNEDLIFILKDKYEEQRKEK